MDSEIVLIKLENKPDRVFTIDEIETIYNLVIEGKAVICGVTDRTEEETVNITNLFANKKESVDAIKKVFSDARVGALEESTGLAGYKYQIWTRIERAVEILAGAGLAVNDVSKKEKIIETEKEPSLAAK